MGMSFQGPPPPPPAFWKEPAFWVTLAFAAAVVALAALSVDRILQVCALLAGSVSVASYSYLRLGVAREVHKNLSQTGLLRRRGTD